MGCNDRPVAEISPELLQIGHDMDRRISNPDFDAWGTLGDATIRQKRAAERTVGARFISQAFDRLAHQGLIDLGVITNFISEEKGVK